ncbi:hypothetical protein BY458DRAFT_487380 [Sporodiniella umbellata]|nr:hypothetical protein BY458DRAFT_487380 [Sporodiniella umbellata]
MFDPKYHFEYSLGASRCLFLMETFIQEYHYWILTMKKTLSTKRSISQFSFPDTNVRYQDVKPCLIDDDNAKRLVLEVKTMNALFNSSICPDNKKSAVAGAFSANRFISSRNTRVFIEKRKLEKVEIMANENKEFDGTKFFEQHLLYPFNEHAQLCILRSNFDYLSTYLCYCFSPKFINDVQTIP